MVRNLLSKLKYPLLALGVILLLGKPMFYLADYIYQPKTHEIVAKEKLEKNKNKEVVSDLRTKKKEFDEASSYIDKRVKANEYNELIEEHKDLKIDQYTNLPKNLSTKDDKRE